MTWTEITEKAIKLTLDANGKNPGQSGFDANRSDAFPLSSRPLGFGRNSLTTSSQVQLDLRVLKFFKMGEHAKLDLVAESFNALNHTNFALTSANRNLSSGQFGQLSSTSTFNGGATGGPRVIQITGRITF